MTDGQGTHAATAPGRSRDEAERAFGDDEPARRRRRWWRRRKQDAKDEAADPVTWGCCALACLDWFVVAAVLAGAVGLRARRGR